MQLHVHRRLSSRHAAASDKNRTATDPHRPTPAPLLRWALLCRPPRSMRNPDASLYFCPAVRRRGVDGIAVAVPHDAARRADSSDSVYRPTAPTDLGNPPRTPWRNTPGRGHSGDTRTPLCCTRDSYINDTPRSPPDRSCAALDSAWRGRHKGPADSPHRQPRSGARGRSGIRTRASSSSAWLRRIAKFSWSAKIRISALSQINIRGAEKNRSRAPRARPASPVNANTIAAVNPIGNTASPIT